MLIFRDYEHSVLLRVKTLFASPPNGFTRSYNVYGEDKFMDDKFSPTPPFIFVLDKRVRPKQTRLPLMVIERGPGLWAPYEIGTRAGTLIAFNLHCWGRNRGEAADLMGFIYQNLDPLPLYDFATATPTFRYTVALENKMETGVGVSPEVGLEGTLQNWESLIIDFRTKE